MQTKQRDKKKGKKNFFTKILIPIKKVLIKFKFYFIKKKKYDFLFFSFSFLMLLLIIYYSFTDFYIFCNMRIEKKIEKKVLQILLYNECRIDIEEGEKNLIIASKKFFEYQNKDDEEIYLLKPRDYLNYKLCEMKIIIKPEKKIEITETKVPKLFLINKEEALTIKIICTDKCIINSDTKNTKKINLEITMEGKIYLKNFQMDFFRLILNNGYAHLENINSKNTFLKLNNSQVEIFLSELILLSLHSIVSKYLIISDRLKKDPLLWKIPELFPLFESNIALISDYYFFNFLGDSAMVPSIYNKLNVNLKYSDMILTTPEIYSNPKYMLVGLNEFIKRGFFVMKNFSENDMISFSKSMDPENIVNLMKNKNFAYINYRSCFDLKLELTKYTHLIFYKNNIIDIFDINEKHFSYLSKNHLAEFSPCKDMYLNDFNRFNRFYNVLKTIYAIQYFIEKEVYFKNNSIKLLLHSNNMRKLIYTFPREVNERFLFNGDEITSFYKDLPEDDRTDAFFLLSWSINDRIVMTRFLPQIQGILFNNFVLIIIFCSCLFFIFMMLKFCTYVDNFFVYQKLRKNRKVLLKDVAIKNKFKYFCCFNYNAFIKGFIGSTFRESNDSLFSFYNHIFIKSKLEEDKKLKIISKEKISKIYSNYCYLYNLNQIDLDDEKSIKELNQYGYCINKSNGKIEYVINCSYANENDKMIPDSNKNSFSEFFNQRIIIVENGYKTKFSDFKIKYKKFCEEKNLKEVDIDVNYVMKNFSILISQEDEKFIVSKTKYNIYSLNEDFITKFTKIKNLTKKDIKKYIPNHNFFTLIIWGVITGIYESIFLITIFFASEIADPVHNMIFLIFGKMRSETANLLNLFSAGNFDNIFSIVFYSICLNYFMRLIFNTKNNLFKANIWDRFFSYFFLFIFISNILTFINVKINLFKIFIRVYNLVFEKKFYTISVLVIEAVGTLFFIFYIFYYFYLRKKLLEKYKFSLLKSILNNFKLEKYNKKINILLLKNEMELLDLEKFSKNVEIKNYKNINENSFIVDDSVNQNPLDVFCKSDKFIIDNDILQFYNKYTKIMSNEKIRKILFFIREFYKRKLYKEKIRKENRIFEIVDLCLGEFLSEISTEFKFLINSVRSKKLTEENWKTSFLNFFEDNNSLKLLIFLYTQDNLDVNDYIVYFKDELLDEKIKKLYNLNLINFKEKKQMINYIKLKYQNKTNQKIFNEKDIKYLNNILGQSGNILEKDCFEVIFDLKYKSSFSADFVDNDVSNQTNIFIQFYFSLKDVMNQKNSEINFCLRNLKKNQYFTRLLNNFQMTEKEFYGMLNLLKRKNCKERMIFLKHLCRCNNIASYYDIIYKYLLLIDLGQNNKVKFLEEYFEKEYYIIIRYFFGKNNFHLEEVLKETNLWKELKKERFDDDLEKEFFQILRTKHYKKYKEFLNKIILDKREKFLDFISLIFEINVLEINSFEKVNTLFCYIYPEIENNQNTIIKNFFDLIFFLKFCKNKYLIVQKISEFLYIDKIMFLNFFRNLVYGESDQQIKLYFSYYLENRLSKKKKINVIEKYKNYNLTILPFLELIRKIENSFKHKKEKFLFKNVFSILFNFKIDIFSDFSLYDEFFSTLLPKINEKSLQFLKSLFYSLLAKDPVFICKTLKINLKEQDFFHFLLDVYFSDKIDQNHLFQKILLKNDNLSDEQKKLILFLFFLNRDLSFETENFQYKSEDKSLNKNFFYFFKLFRTNSFDVSFFVEKLLFSKKINGNFKNKKNFKLSEKLKEISIFFQIFNNSKNHSSDQNFFSILENLKISKNNFDYFENNSEPNFSKNLKKFLNTNSFRFVLSYFNIEKEEFLIIYLLIKKKLSFLELNKITERMNLSTKQSQTIISLLYLLKENFQIKKNDIKFIKDITSFFNQYEFNLLGMLICIIKKNFYLFSKISKKSLFGKYLENPCIDVMIKVSFYFFSKKEKKNILSHEHNKKSKNCKNYFFEKILKNYPIMGKLILFDYISENENLKIVFENKLQKMLDYDYFYLVLDQMFLIKEKNLDDFFFFVGVFTNFSFLMFMKNNQKKNDDLKRKIQNFYLFCYNQNFFEKVFSLDLNSDNQLLKGLKIENVNILKKDIEEKCKKHNITELKNSLKTTEILIKYLFKRFTKNLANISDNSNSSRFLDDLNFSNIINKNTNSNNNEEKLILNYLLIKILKFSTFAQKEKYIDIQRIYFIIIRNVLRIISDKGELNDKINKIELKIFDLINLNICKKKEFHDLITEEKESMIGQIIISLDFFWDEKISKKKNVLNKKKEDEMDQNLLKKNISFDSFDFFNLERENNDSSFFSKDIEIEKQLSTKHNKNLKKNNISNLSSIQKKRSSETDNSNLLSLNFLAQQSKELDKDPRSISNSMKRYSFVSLKKNNQNILKKNAIDEEKDYTNIFQIWDNILSFEYHDQEEISYLTKNIDDILENKNLEEIKKICFLYNNENYFWDLELKKFDIDQNVFILIDLLYFENNRNIFKTFKLKKFFEKFFKSDFNNLCKLFDYFLNGWKIEKIQNLETKFGTFFKKDTFNENIKQNKIFVDLYMLESKKALQVYLESFEKTLSLKMKSNLLDLFELLKNKKWTLELFVNLGKNFLNFSDKTNFLLNIFKYCNSDLSKEQKIKCLSEIFSSLKISDQKIKNITTIYKIIKNISVKKFDYLYLNMQTLSKKLNTLFNFKNTKYLRLIQIFDIIKKKDKIDENFRYLVLDLGMDLENINEISSFIKIFNAFKSRNIYIILETLKKSEKKFEFGIIFFYYFFFNSKKNFQIIAGCPNLEIIYVNSEYFIYLNILKQFEQNDKIKNYLEKKINFLYEFIYEKPLSDLFNFIKYLNKENPSETKLENFELNFEEVKYYKSYYLFLRKNFKFQNKQIKDLYKNLKDRIFHKKDFNKNTLLFRDYIYIKKMIANNEIENLNFKDIKSQKLKSILFKDRWQFEMLLKVFYFLKNIDNDFSLENIVKNLVHFNFSFLEEIKGETSCANISLNTSKIDLYDVEFFEIIMKEKVDSNLFFFFAKKIFEKINSQNGMEFNFNLKSKKVTKERVLKDNKKKQKIYLEILKSLKRLESLNHYSSYKINDDFINIFIEITSSIFERQIMTKKSLKNYMEILFGQHYKNKNIRNYCNLFFQINNIQNNNLDKQQVVQAFKFIAHKLTERELLKILKSYSMNSIFFIIQFSVLIYITFYIKDYQFYYYQVKTNFDNNVLFYILFTLAVFSFILIKIFQLRSLLY